MSRSPRLALESRKVGEDPRARTEPEYRPATASPLPAIPFEDQVAEMFANDDEAIEWQRSERLGDLFGRAR